MLLFQDALAVKIWMDLLKELRSYGGFKLRGRVSFKFSAPPSGKTMRRTPKRFRGARTCSRSSHTDAKFGGAAISPTARAAKNVESFCWFVCLLHHAFEHQRLCARFRCEGVGIQKRFCYRFYSAPQCWHCKRCTSYGISVRLSPSVARRYCDKTTARSTVQFALPDSKMSLVL